MLVRKNEKDRVLLMPNGKNRNSKEGMPSKMDAHLMTVEDVADYLRVKPSTVYEWAKQGKLPASKVGRLWRFERKEIEAWVRNSGPQMPADRRSASHEQL